MDEMRVSMQYLERQNNVEPSLLEKIATRKKLAVGVALSMLAVVVLVTLLLPKLYRADLKVLLKNERVNPVVSSDSQTEGLYYVDQVSEARINTETELMRSRQLIREVVRRCNLASREHSSSAEKRLDLAVKHLEENLTIAPVRRSDIIAVSYTSKDPAEAAKVLRTLMELYLEFHLRLHSAPGAADVFRQMAGNYARERDVEQAKLDQFKKQHAIASLPDEKALTLQQVADLSKQRSDVEVAIKRDQNQRSRLQEFIATTPPIVERERRSLPNQLETEQLNVNLVNLENKRVEAAARYQPTDRVVHDIDEQIRVTQEALNTSQRTKSEEVSTERNTLHVSAQSDFMKTDTEIAGLTRQASEIQRQLSRQQKRISDLDGDTAAYDALTRAVARLADLNQVYEKKAYEAQAGELLDKERVANVAIVEAPMTASSPVSPKRGLLLLIGTIWAVVLGLATALIADLTAKRIESPYDLELALGAPLVGLLPTDAAIPGYNEMSAAIYSSLYREPHVPAWRLS
jgi:uncharacterized protein involved in exopolysaccharide biosynthesis